MAENLTEYLLKTEQFSLNIFQQILIFLFNISLSNIKYLKFSHIIKINMLGEIPKVFEPISDLANCRSLKYLKI